MSLEQGFNPVDTEGRQFAMFNPTTGGVGVCYQEQFDNLWKPRDWEKLAIPAEFVRATLALTQDTALGDLEREQLVKVVNAWQNQPKPEIVEQLVESNTAPELKAAAKNAGVKATGTKEQVAEALADHAKDASPAS